MNRFSRKSRGRVKRRIHRRSRNLIINSRNATDVTEGTTSLTRLRSMLKSWPLLRIRNPKRVWMIQRVIRLLLLRPLTLPNHQQISLVKEHKTESSSVASSTSRMRRMITSMITMATTTMMMTCTTMRRTMMRITTMRRMT